MIDAHEIGQLQDGWTELWHSSLSGGEVEDRSLMKLVRANHRANFDLWHEEDKARAPRATDAEVARVKRAIDGLNQQRNDLVEGLDQRLYDSVPAQSAEAPLHSETPGMMIDRMSILALKIFHTREEMERVGASEEHRVRNGKRLEVLERQRSDLSDCLARLWRDVEEGRCRFKIYRQMKMYNDPDLNPAIYGSGASGIEG